MKKKSLLENKILISLKHDSNELCTQSISQFVILESYILNKSKEEFSNTEPCMIIRTQIMNQVFEELYHFFKACLLEQRTHLTKNELPKNLQACLDLDPLVNCFELHEGGSL